MSGDVGIDGVSRECREPTTGSIGLLQRRSLARQ